METEQLDDFVRCLPNLSGVYIMKDDDDNIIYIGKAISLKKRVGQYFRKSTQHSPKNKVLVANIKSIEYIVTESDVEALILESNLIKQHRPRYNVRLRDDKGYPYIKVNIKSKYPRASLSRRRIRDGSLYFGPFTNSDSVRKTLKLLSRVFKIRPCAKRITGKEARPCLNYHIDQCLAPCVSSGGEGIGITKEEYNKAVDDAVAFLRGDIGHVTRIIEKRMAEYVQQREYEKAAKMRDDLAAIADIHKKQMITVAGKGDKDVIAMARSGLNDLSAAIQVFFIRDGSLVGRGDYQVDTGGNSDGSVISSFVSEYYQDFPIPSEIVSDIEMDDVATIEAWMHEKTGRKIHIHKAGTELDMKLVDMAKKNAGMLLEQYHLRAERAEKATYGALIELQEVLNLDRVPEVIECFDISHISGTDTVASLVVFENGVAKNSRYRHFKIHDAPKGDDYAAMHEVVGRHFRRLAEDGEELGKLPDLVVVDGGKGQLNAAIGARREAGVVGVGVSGIPIIALAKQFEHIFTPDSDEPIVLSRNSPALHLLQRLRDESHRFATRLHRKLRSSRLSESVLDGIEGVGPKRVALLLAHFGSVEAIRKADVEEIAGVGAIGRGLGERIVEYLERNV